MKFKTAMLSALREVRDELRGLRVAVVERHADIDHRLRILEEESPRTERRLLDVETKVMRVG